MSKCKRCDDSGICPCKNKSTKDKWEVEHYPLGLGYVEVRVFRNGDIFCHLTPTDFDIFRELTKLKFKWRRQ